MTDTQEDTSPSGPGSALRTARETLGYSVQDMADALNLTARAVADIEAERWSRFPALAFARGYVRAYAKLLGLDGDDLLVNYRGFGATPTPAGRPMQGVTSSHGIADLVARQPGTVISGAVLAVVCVVLVVLYFVWPKGSDESIEAPKLAALPTSSAGAFVPGGSRPASAAAPATQVANDVTPVDVEPYTVGTEPSPATVVIPPAVATVDTTPGLADRSADASTASTPALAADPADGALETVARAPQSSVRRISPEGDDRVDFEFTEDCWVEVADAGGRNFSDLARAGDTLVLVGQAPFKIRLGYGPGASIAFNGQVVALAPHTRRNVTSLVLDPTATAAATH